MNRWWLRLLSVLFVATLMLPQSSSALPSGKDALVAVAEMDMLILPGTRDYLRKTIQDATSDGAAILVIKLDTPGGVLETTQEMIQDIFKSPIPIVIYVSPSGGTAASAGVFITLAAHVAAMAPGTSIGAAHPVAGDGKDIEGDMRTKAENITVAMVKSITEARGRNPQWAEKAVKESSSLTEKEALDLKVIDLVARDLDDLLSRLKGKTIKLETATITLADYSTSPRKDYQIGTKEKLVNVLANPNVAALLMLGATTGLTLELYNPGAILPGVVGVICLILVLTVSQIIPLTQGGMLLMLLGALMIGAELWFPSGVLAIGGIVAIVLGSIYLIDTAQAPGMSVSLELILPVALLLAGILFLAMRLAFSALRAKVSTGQEGLVGLTGEASENFSSHGIVFVNGEIWKAALRSGVVAKGDVVRVVGIKDGLVLEVERV